MSTAAPQATAMIENPIARRAATAIVAALAALALLGAFAPDAHAGTYDVVGCNEAPVGQQNKQPFTLGENSGQNQVLATNQCPFNGTTQNGVYIRNNSGNVCNTCGAFADVSAPPGAVITGVAISRVMSTLPSEPWEFMAINSAGQKIDGCQAGESGTCNNVNQLGPGFTDIADTNGISYRIICRDTFNGCQETDTTKPWIKISNIRLRIDDTTNPTLTPPGGSAWTSAPIAGTKTVTATGTDSAGIKSSILVVDGTDDPTTARNYACDFTNPAPCPSSQSTTNDLNTTRYPDGQHTLKLKVVDAGNNVTLSAPQTINIDNSPPAPPTITEAPGPVTQFDGAHFEWRGAEPGGSFECRLDAGSWTPCTSPKDYTGLSNGAHTFSVRQVDAANNPGAAATHAWTIRELVSDTDGDPVDSDDCTTPDATVADGFAGQSYVNVAVATPSDKETWICMRAQNAAGSAGGKFVVDSSAVPGQPTVDENPGACSSTPGNQVPPPHPIDAQLGDPAAPPYARVKLDSYTDGRQVWGCIDVTDGTNTFAKRVVLPFLGPGDPVNSVRFEADAVNADIPNPIRDPRPSATCGDGGKTGGTYVSVFDQTLPDGTQAYLDYWQPSGTKAHACARVASGPVVAGGLLTVDGGAQPVKVDVVDGDATPCTLNVAKSDALDVEIRRSAETNPASLCVRRGTDQKRVTLTVDPAQAVVRWTPDPGTPVPPVP